MTYLKNKKIITCFILVLILFGSFSPTILQAQDIPEITPGSLDGLTPEQVQELVEQNRQIADETFKKNQELMDAAEAEGGCPHWYSFGCKIQFGFKKTIEWLFYDLLGYVFGLLVWLAGRSVDLSIYISVTNFHDFINMQGVEKAWKTLRDTANIGFIFILLYIGIGTVLRLDGVDYKKMIPKVILIAILINFSGFATKTAIDISNVFAYELYSQIAPSNSTNKLLTYGFGGRFVGAMKMSSYAVEYDPNKADSEPNNPSQKPGGSLGIMATIVAAIGNNIRLLITSWVLFAVAILMFIRAIVLVMLYVLSPLAFFSYAVPKHDQLKKWWEKLSKQLIFAPALLLMLGLVLVMSEGSSVETLATSAINATKNTATGAVNSPTALGVFLLFAIVNGLTIAALVVANHFGAVGSKMASNLGAKANANLLRAGGRSVKFASKKTGLTDFAKNNARRLDSTLAGVNIRGVNVGAAYTASKDATKKVWKRPELKPFTDALTHPLDTMNEKVAQSMEMAGFGGFGGPLGNTRGERAKAKKEEEERKKEEEAQEIKKIDTQLQDAAARGDVTTIQSIIGGLDEKQVGKLDSKTIALPLVSIEISPRQWIEIVKNTKFNNTEISSITHEVSTAATLPFASTANGGNPTNAYTSWNYMQGNNVKYFFNLP
ncbi:MAG: hypothetical protein QG665_401 [Patescibacteria group bacterium]|nr:hypothetical protein [Patescibacteria group bacterium]